MTQSKWRIVERRGSCIRRRDWWTITSPSLATTVTSPSCISVQYPYDVVFAHPLNIQTIESSTPDITSGIFWRSLAKRCFHNNLKSNSFPYISLLQMTCYPAYIWTMHTMPARKYITWSILKKKIPVIPPLDHPYKRLEGFFSSKNVFLCPQNMVSGQQIEYIILSTWAILERCTLPLDLK